MSPKNPVYTLSYLCNRFVTFQIIQLLAVDDGKNYEIVADYLSDATYEIIQDLLKNILNSENLDASTRFSCLEVLLRPDIQKLDTGMFPHLYYESILRVIIQKGIGLRQLNLKGVWVRDYPTILSQLIRNLKKIKVLTIPHMADDQVLKALADCGCLTALDISGECSFTADGLRLLKNRKLTALDLGNFGKIDLCQQQEEQTNSIVLMATVIENLPNLQYPRVYSFTGRALHYLQQKYRNYQTKIKYLHDIGTTNDIIDAIIDLCPQLESLHIDNAESGVISKLGSINKLNCLKLTKPKLEEFFDFLTDYGWRVQILKLNHNKSTSLDLSEICLNAPNLLTLECFQMRLIYTQIDTFFMNLQNIEILYCDISDTTIKYLLLNTPFLKRIVCGCVLNLIDGDIFRLCAELDFNNLEELWFSCAKNLTITSVELLMGHCPNLKVIGQLNGWSVHQDEIDYLRSVILYSNTDLTLLPLGSLV